VASALGFMVAPPATDMVRTQIFALNKVNWPEINALYAEMKSAGLRLLSEAGADPSEVVYRPTADMRHRGQGFEISVALPGDVLSENDLDAIRANFFEAYKLQFGRALEGSPIEVVNWRLACTAPSVHIDISEGRERTELGLELARRGERKVLFEEMGWLDCAVYDRYKLPPGCVFAGPALVEERESTCVIGPGATARIDQAANLIIEVD